MSQRAKPAVVSYEPVNASPVKSFFVTMLTRDISLPDAILDLLDNCVDGLLRTEGKPDAPFDGYEAAITFDESTFTIHDNCGGIPWKLKDYAFRMGRPADQPEKSLPMVGVYGIGMKRAIFKMGEQCLISTRHGRDNYEVEITPGWIADEAKWDIPVKAGTAAWKEDGTTIVIGALHEGIARTFGEGAKAFHAELARRVAEQYAFIIAKGFKVSINKERVEPRPTKLVFTPVERRKMATQAISPFIYRAKIDSVNVFLAIGLTRAIPTAEEVEAEDSGAPARYRSLSAGWTVVCNERAVLYCDRTELTGWGEDDIPRYHTQFIAISGIVEFRSNDASKLPTTTTKRGIDASSPLYLQVKNKMREGLRLFTAYTYRWKGRESEARALIEKKETVTFSELRTHAEKLPMRKVLRVPGGEQFKPNLPRPRLKESTLKRISFEKPLDEIRIVGDYVLDDPEAAPARVGEECFKRMFREANR